MASTMMNIPENIQMVKTKFGLSREQTLQQALYGRKTNLKYARKNRDTEKVKKLVNEIKQLNAEIRIKNKGRR